MSEITTLEGFAEKVWLERSSRSPLVLKLYPSAEAYLAANEQDLIHSWMEQIKQEEAGLLTAESLVRCLKERLGFQGERLNNALFIMLRGLWTPAAEEYLYEAITPA